MEQSERPSNNFGNRRRHCVPGAVLTDRGLLEKPPNLILSFFLLARSSCEKISPAISTVTSLNSERGNKVARLEAKGAGSSPGPRSGSRPPIWPSLRRDNRQAPRSFLVGAGPERSGVTESGLLAPLFFHAQPLWPSDPSLSDRQHPKLQKSYFLNSLAVGFRPFSRIKVR